MLSMLSHCKHCKSTAQHAASIFVSICFSCTCTRCSASNSPTSNPDSSNCSTRRGTLMFRRSNMRKSDQALREGVLRVPLQIGRLKKNSKTHAADDVISLHGYVAYFEIYIACQDGVEIHCVHACKLLVCCKILQFVSSFNNAAFQTFIFVNRYKSQIFTTSKIYFCEKAQVL